MLCAGGKSGEIIPHKLFAMAGTGYISAMVCSIEALKYVNFPTKELGKSCKVTSCCNVHKLLLYLASALQCAHYYHCSLYSALYSALALVHFQCILTAFYMHRCCMCVCFDR
jgi:hypothetical protein